MKIEDVTEQHKYPHLLRQHPGLIHLHYFILKVLFLRSRVCHRRLRQILTHRSSKINHILDAGCGEGQYLVPLSLTFSELNFTGIDQDVNHIEFLNKLKSRKPINNCTFLHEDISFHLGKDDLYNLIYIIGVLQYTSNPAETIKSCALSLKASGLLMIYTPIRTNLHFRFYEWIREKYGHYDDAQAVYKPIDESQLDKWINSAGFQIICKEYHYGVTGTLGHEICQSLIILITHWPGLLKIIPCLLFIILSPIFVSLQIVDSLIRSETRKRGNGILLILQK